MPHSLRENIKVILIRKMLLHQSSLPVQSNPMTVYSHCVIIQWHECGNNITVEPQQTFVYSSKLHTDTDQGSL